MKEHVLKCFLDKFKVSFFACANVPTKIINARTLIPNNLYFIHDSLLFLYKINQFYTNKEDRLVYQIHDKIPVTKWRPYKFYSFDLTHIFPTKCCPCYHYFIALSDPSRISCKQ